jgi:hypothetical protein
LMEHRANLVSHGAIILGYGVTIFVRVKFSDEDGRMKGECRHQSQRK